MILDDMRELLEEINKEVMKEKKICIECKKNEVDKNISLLICDECFVKEEVARFTRGLSY